jgi:hypothetical protein
LDFLLGGGVDRLHELPGSQRPEHTGDKDTAGHCWGLVGRVQVMTAVGFERAVEGSPHSFREAWEANAHERNGHFLREAVFHPPGVATACVCVFARERNAID